MIQSTMKWIWNKTNAFISENARFTIVEFHLMNVKILTILLIYLHVRASDLKNYKPTFSTSSSYLVY